MRASRSSEMSEQAAKTPHLSRLIKPLLLSLVLLAAHSLTSVRANVEQNNQQAGNAKVSEEQQLREARDEVSTFKNRSDAWQLVKNQELPTRGGPDELTPALDELVNRVLEEAIKSPTGVEESQQNEKRYSPKRDLANQSLATDESDALVQDEHQDVSDRFQYDQLVGDDAALLKRDSTDERSQVVSRYTAASDLSQADESIPSQNATAQAQESHQLQNRNSAGRAMTGLTKIAHHSKPPYATGDQFITHQQGSSASSGIPNELPLLNLNKGTTATMSEVIPTDNDTGIEQTFSGKQHQVNGSSSSTQDTNSKIANSIKHISTNLVNEAQKEMSDSSRQPPVNENLLEKLTPVNSIVYLNPIAFDEPSSSSNQLTMSKDPPLQWDANNMRMYGSFPSSSSSSNDSDYAAAMNSLQYSSGDALSLQGSSEASRQMIASASQPVESDRSTNSLSNQLTRKTFETLSNQLKQQQLQPEYNSMNLTSQLPVNNMIHRSGPVTHYAASLTNVTAPLIPPHSATEAMETSLGEQAGREILNQVSGFLRQANHSLHQRQQKPQNQQRNSLADQVKSQSIYLPPANSFIPPRPAPRPALESLSASMSQNDPIISAATNNSSTDRRLDHYSHTQRPISLLVPQLPVSSPSQPASGFRTPAAANVAGQLSPPGGALWPSPHLSSYYNMPLAVANAQDSGTSSEATPSTSSSELTIPSKPQNTSSMSSLPIQSSSNTFSPAPTTASLSSSTNGFITNGVVLSAEQTAIHQQQQQISSTTPSSAATTPLSSTSISASGSTTTEGPGAGQANALNRRVFNLTRVEHISAECSQDLIRTIIVFNGTFRGMIYSSGYVRDSSCIYVNGTGKTRYDFSIRLNQCGTLARQELHPAGKDNDVRRRDQVMWNTLSIQYNPVIEQEWDEHFRVSCEYGSDFWKTVSFNPFNVETNTGSPVVFTVDPPQCQMEILRGHGMVGPRQETISGPVTVGDPLTLLIHMKSERAGYDILVKNCIAHDNSKQRMQLIDSNGCVVNERFISPFRGTYNDNDLKHVTLYAYLKAFRFTGSPILYLECEIHMCQSSCPPQMCYWRRLSKRSALGSNGTQTVQYLGDDESEDEEITKDRSLATNSTGLLTRQNFKRGRESRKMKDSERDQKKPPALSDKMSLTQSLLVRPLDDPDAAAYSMQQQSSEQMDKGSTSSQLLCYKRAEVLAFLLATGSLLLVAMSVTVACCWQQTRKLKQFRRSNLAGMANNFGCGASSSLPSLSSANSTSSSSDFSSRIYNLNRQHVRSVKQPFGATAFRQQSIGRHKERLLVLSLLQACVI